MSLSPSLLAGGLLLGLSSLVQAGLLITEIMPGSQHQLVDEDGERSDWVEVFNSGNESVNLGEYSLTDDGLELQKWSFPDRELAPGSFLTVFASGKDRKGKAALHTNFKLKADGEYLALIRNSDDGIIDEYAPRFPKVGKGQSCGYRFKGDLVQPGHVTVFVEPSPGKKNGGELAQPKVEDTNFSVDRGFYKEPFEVVISSRTPGAIIRYTTDGSLPTADHGTVYKEPIKITTTTVLRAGAMKDGHVPTNVDTVTYLFPADVVRQPADPEGWPTHYEGEVHPFFGRRFGPGKMDEKGVPVDYAMSPPEDLGATAAEVEAALLAIPSFSIVTDRAHLFDKESGIHVKPEIRGRTSERPVSVELMDPNGLEKGFQVDAGIRVRGGHSRSVICQKHAYRLYFRKEYGVGELEYPLFGDEGVDRFDDIDLRTAQNYSYHYNDDARQNTFVREVFSRDSQRALGQPYARSLYYHLYLNGLYWGLYQTQEHTEASYGANYLGGDEDDYDTVKAKASSDGRATDGTDEGWRHLWEQADLIAKADSLEEQMTIYNALQGLDPQGKEDESLPVYLDVDNLIDYMLVVFVTGSFDGPVTQFARNFASNNWFSIWRRGGRDGFKFFCHDAEHSLGSVPGFSEINRVGPFVAGSSYQTSNPQWVHQQLTSLKVYREQFRARAEEVLRPGGALSKEANLIRVRHRAQEVRRAIVAECARWGDTRVQPGVRKNDWEEAIARLEEVINDRASVVPGHLAAAQRFPKGVPARELVDAPLFNPVPAPTFRQEAGEGTFRAKDGEVYYRTDGLDPRGEQGGARAGNEKAVSDRAVNHELIVGQSEVRVHVPTDGSMGSDWVHPEFDDSTWTVGRGGVGYDQRPDYLELIEMDVKNKIHGKGTTLFARYQFETPELPHYDKLILRLKVEDGYAIFLNGTEVAREGFEGDPSWNSRAAPRSDQAAMQWHYIDLTAHAELLGKGSNVLAIWLINERAESSDLLLLPELYLEEVIPGSVVKASPDKGLLARTLLDGQWSPLYEFPAGAKNGSAKSAKPGSVVISEIMYHPAEPSESEVEAGFGKKSDFEFLELANVDKEAVDLAGVYCRKGIHLLVGSPLVVAPGERVILARNPDGFRQRYPKQKVAATYQGNLGNGSESITLRTASGAALGAVSYKDDSPWPEEADGEGYSLVLKKLSPEVDLDAAENWVASEKVGGSPGQP